MKSENRESARNADAPTPKDLHFPELTASKFAPTAVAEKPWKPSAFPPRNRKKSSALFIGITLNKPTQAATFAHIRRFSFPRKIYPTSRTAAHGAFVGLLWQGINYTIMASVFNRYFVDFSRLISVKNYGSILHNGSGELH